MATVNDNMQYLALDTNDGYKILMWKIQDSSVLLVGVEKAVDEKVYTPKIEEMLEIIEQGMVLILLF